VYADFCEQYLAIPVVKGKKTESDKFAGAVSTYAIEALTPVDVHIIEEDDKTIVQPDVLVVCDRNKVTNHGIEGAPDLIVEVMSLSTKKKDMTVKLDKYIEAGVREYWLVDPQKKKVITYLSGEGELVDDLDVKLYGFEDQIPVMIFENQCIVDMKRIYEDNGFLFDLMERDAKK
ncbi:MAG: Uma2 family endonuclease, partial [Firmicutes bacterium]|nr:Uma2 family endonuclease [Bacillota bacterium]